MPSVSVVMPVFNAQDTVGRAIRSILDQTLPDIQLVVVDDGSTDQSPQIVSAISDPRLLFLQENHQGVSRTSNTALQHATSKFIARMDADDFADPERLQLQLERLHEQDLDVVGSRIRITKPTGEGVPSMSRYEQWINQETIGHDEIMALRFVEFPLVNPTILARRKYFDLQFANNDFPEDYDLMLRAASLGMKFGKVNASLLEWTDGDQRLTRNDSRYSSDAFMACRRHHFHHDVLSGVETVDLWGSGKTGKLWFRWLRAIGLRVRRIIEVNPRKVGTSLDGVDVIHCDEMPISDGTVMVSAVGAMGARDMISKHAATRGYQMGEDLWFVA
ncbi:MAG: glycosyltransferase family 2 protein [Fuerstiella sp.]